jgi:hypothetical protein
MEKEEEGVKVDCVDYAPIYASSFYAPHASKYKSSPPPAPLTLTPCKYEISTVIKCTINIIRLWTYCQSLTFESMDKNASDLLVFPWRNICTCTKIRHVAPEDGSLAAVHFQSCPHSEDNSSSSFLRSSPCPSYWPGQSICAPDSGDAEQLPQRSQIWGSKRCKSRRPSSPLCACEAYGVAERRMSCPRSGSRSSKSAPGNCRSQYWSHDDRSARYVSVIEHYIETPRRKCHRKALSASGSRRGLNDWWRRQAPGALDFQYGTPCLWSCHIHICRTNTSNDRSPANRQVFCDVFLPIKRKIHLGNDGHFLV